MDVSQSRNLMPMLPKAVYELLPYSYLVISMLLMGFHSDWIVVSFAWVLYTAGAVTWVLRSDARRVNPRRPTHKSNMFLHDDIYESVPFFYIGGGILAMRYLGDGVLLYAGLILLLLGCSILGVRIKKRKISWIDDWRRYRGSATVAKHTHRQRTTSQICDQCLIKESCRSTKLSDKSNIRIMEWLSTDHEQSEVVKLRWDIDELEFSPVSEERLLKVMLQHKKYHDQCLVLNNRRKMKLRAVS